MAAASVGALMLTAALPASASRPRPGALVTGTYTVGSAQAWWPLPATRVGGNTTTAVDATVVVDPSQQRQRYSGMGFSLDETSVSNWWKLTPSAREEAIRLLVDPKTGAGLNRFRLTIGSPDLIEHLPFWSYDELPAGVTTDWDLKYFSIKRDIDAHMVEAARLILKYNPKATFFGSAWSAPAWMKTNNKFVGEAALIPGSTTSYYQVGKLRDDAVDVFARYYVKYIQAYAKQGVKVDAITLLNEPGIDVVYPAMDIPIAQQQKLAVAIKREFAAARLNTQLYVNDFNFWDWKHPTSTTTKNYWRIFEDQATKNASDAIAFHPYWGDPSVMRDAYQQYGKPVHMTETSDLNPATILNYFRLDVSSYVMWAQTTDQDGGTLHWTPARDNNLDWDQVAATTHWTNRLVKVNIPTKSYTVRDELYAMGQFAKYLTPRDVRVESSASAGGISNVVFRGKNDKFTAIVGNGNAAAKRVRVVLGDESFVQTIPGSSYTTFSWKGDVPSARRNHAPVFAAAAPVTVDQYATTSFQLSATDRDRDKLSYYAIDLPDGVSLDGATGKVTVKATAAGVRDLTFYVTDGAARAATTVKLTVAPKPAPIGEKVEAESYSAQNGWTEGGANFVENTASASGGRNIGWTAAGNWLQYDVNVAKAGTYNLELRVANGSGATSVDAVSFRDASGAVLAKVSVPDTTGWAAYQSLTAKVTLPAGDQKVTVFCETGGFNLDYFRLS
jgi:glucosylceramidase